MSGLVKAKKYDWKDSNIALIGTDTDRQVKKESAATEPAWRGAGQAVGKRIWRIEQFKVVDWPKEDYGNFYSGDSYILLNTYKEPDARELKYDVHFWIGKESTQDEYGTAAYKTVELDTFLNDAPVQHREVEGHESALFKNYFTSITTMKGGAATGFRKVTPEQYKTRLMQFKRVGKRVEVTQVPLCKRRLNTDDVFILDAGRKIFQWNGMKCNKDEKLKAVMFLQELKNQRHGKASSEAVDEGDEDEDFWQQFEKEDEDDDDDDTPDEKEEEGVKVFRLSDAQGNMKTSLEQEGKVCRRSSLDTKDVFLVDTTKELFVWVGKRTSKGEKQNALIYAHKYLMNTPHPWLSVTVLKEGADDKRFSAFNSAMAA